MAKDHHDQQTIDAFPFPPRRGRPRKYASDAERVRAWRQRQERMRSAPMVERQKARVRTEFLLPTAHKFAIEAVAKKRGISQSELLVQLLDSTDLFNEWLDDSTK